MQPFQSSAFGAWVLLGLALTSQPAQAQVNLGSMPRSWARTPSVGSSLRALPLRNLFSRGQRGGVPLIVHSASGGVSAPELVSMNGLALGELAPERLGALSAEHPDWIFDWAPPRHVLLDRVDGWVHAKSVRETTHTSGQGVVVGIVDTGVELTHKDLRTRDGKTRVAWLLDVSRPPQQLHPELEAAYGCNLSLGCAVYAAADLDALLANEISGDEPSDPSGHGTHVASLAAGNGLSSPDPRYVGVAPEATYVIARVAQTDGGIFDGDVLRAVQFVFDRAEELGMPAVVNLSLGSDFGAHDGSSGLELGLSNLVGPRFPGRAIVVAAGNSAGLYDVPSAKYPGPFGIHTEVHVPRSSVSRVPILTPARTGGTVRGTAYVWIGFREGDEVSVGVDDKNGERVPLVAPGEGKKYDQGDVTIQVLNGTVAATGSSGHGPGPRGALVAIDGTWPENSDFEIHLEGHGSAQLWVQGAGDLNSELGLGALFPRGEKEGTINVPASASGLIAVGATLNRTSWVDVTGTPIDLPNVGAIENTPLDTIAYFSSGGPNALGVLKPDIVAPGVFVAGAMARSADPRRSTNGMFANFGRCPNQAECFVVDETHAITSGTSMSAPIVSGAIALLFERDPSLTQDAARAILQAGARPLQGIVIDPGQIGPGALDLDGALSVATAGESPALRIPSSQSWLTSSASLLHPDPDWPLTLYVQLRDDSGKVADGFDSSRLRVDTEPPSLREGLTRMAAGFYRFSVAAAANSGGQTLHVAVSFDGRAIASKDLPIAVDRWVANDGVSARGGCSLGAARSDPRGAGLLLALLAGHRWRRRSRYMRAK